MAAIDARVLNAFNDAIVEILTTMCGIEALQEEPFLKKNALPAADVSCAIDLAGYGKGYIVLAFSESAVTAIISSMLQEEKRTIDHEVKDAVCELTNIVSGDFRRRMESHGFKFEAGIPKVLSAESRHPHFSPTSLNSPVIVLPFKVEGGKPFTVEFAVYNV